MVRRTVPGLANGKSAVDPALRLGGVAVEAQAKGRLRYQPAVDSNVSCTGELGDRIGQQWHCSFRYTSLERPRCARSRRAR